MMNYRESILYCVRMIETNVLTRDDIGTVTKKELAELILDAYDILTDAIAETPDWWERDELAEIEQKERFLASLE